VADAGEGIYIYLGISASEERVSNGPSFFTQSITHRSKSRVLETHSTVFTTIRLLPISLLRSSCEVCMLCMGTNPTTAEGFYSLSGTGV
jgi:hypothetical protein